MPDPSLFDLTDNTEGPSHRAAPSTSRAAAKTNALRSGTQRRQVLSFIVSQADGATDQEIAHALDLAENSIRPRRGELQGMGYIERHVTLTRPTPSGSQASVYIATEAGALALLAAMANITITRKDPT